MPVKRALVVDDARLARVVLGRMLESYKLAVDTSESAEDALEYLSSNKPPHVIFMDHMMPGMDGLEAVQAIKKNPQTAMIPIIMYTSKEGELYMGQARALGAVGVLPKPIKPAELEKIIHSLNLLSDQADLPPPPEARSKPVPPAMTPKKTPPVLHSAIVEVAQEATLKLEHGTVSLLKRLLDDQRTKLKEELTSSTDDIAERVAQILQQKNVASSRWYHFTGDYGWLRLLTLVAAAAILAVLTFWYAGHDDLPDTKTAHGTAETSPGDDAGSTSLANTDLAPMTVARQNAPGEEANATLQEAVEKRMKAEDKNAKLQQTIDTLKTQMVDQKRRLLETVEWTVNLNNQHGFEQMPLGDYQASLLNELISRLTAVDFKGVVRLKVSVGDFCLIRNETGDYKAPPDDMPIQNCQTLGLTPEQSMAQSTRQSFGFTRFLSGAPYNNGKINIDIVTDSKEKPLYKYPILYSIKTAGEWNRAARLNNRVEIVIIPALEKDTELSLH
jgi:CheY-like chemotaxis protein